MTKEDKDLLLKDLCARLPYRVKLQRDNVYDASYKEVELLTVEFLYENEVYDSFESLNIKPYLRPMSSITAEEDKEMGIIGYNMETGDTFRTLKQMDYLNAHHFDYRGLIEKGLAIEAPEGMYKNE